ncbi:MAG TPA: zinc ribbon domain-containing protein, partial [Candidatus Ozemobacteraceae bacterium]|nr:zinc ribbon domain-containing protein [Candidatus Ozemobacteraceae bacterium]
MDQSPKICPKCQQANFPIAEFCRHCGEAIYDLGTMSRGYSLTRLSGYLVDGLFWGFEELARWWELSQLNQALKKLQRRRQQFMERMDEETGGELVDDADRAQLMSLTEEISQVSV